jgi:alpha-glucosidase (family GH31 glycosyl hydrolase)
LKPQAQAEPDSATLTVRHEPLGIEDPYTPQPWERSPRQPHEDEPVTVYAVTEPRGMLSPVQVEIETEREALRRVTAVRADFEGNGDRWKAHLGSFHRGEEVRYRFAAGEPGNSRLVSSWFSFQTIGWRPLNPVTSWEARTAQVRLTMSDKGQPVTTVSIEVIDRNTVRFRTYTGGEAHREPTPGANQCLAELMGEDLTIVSGDLRIRIRLSSGALWIDPVDPSSNMPAMSSGDRPFLSWLGASAGSPHSVGVQFGLSAHEAVYGTGERFDTFNRRGSVSDNRVYEQYKNQGPRTYIPIPVILSSRGYAIFADTMRQLSVDAGAGDPDMLSIKADVGEPSMGMDLYLFFATCPLEALAGYLRHAGMPALPPEWAFGLWMSSNDWNSQERVLHEVRRGEEEGIPGDVVVIEAWSDEDTFYIWNDAEYDLIPPDRPPSMSDFRFPPEGRWPDPRAMIDSLHERGTKLVLWQIPLMRPIETPGGQQSGDVDTVIDRGWCVQNSDGTPYRNPGWWFTGAIVPDLTNNEAVNWWLCRRRYLVEELTVDGFKTDGGEHLWGADLRFADGRRSDELINAFPVLYASAYQQLLRECGHEQGMTFSRAGYAGSQLYPAHWAGDENSTWDAFRHSIAAGLSAGASGIPFWGWDIAGFSEEIPSSELYRRAWMMATFCPIMQYHSEFNANRTPSRDRTPWNIAEQTGDPDILPLCRYYLAIRKWLTPYIMREARHTAVSGRPLMCALALDYHDDLQARQYSYQYMFGRDLLVAPTVDEGCREQTVYLPAGTWSQLQTGEVTYGPIEVTMNVPLDFIPVFARAGAPSPLDRALNESLTARQFVR